MKLGFIFFASALLLACDQGETDIGDLPMDSESGGETGGETGTTTTGVDCSGESCLDGCCEGFGCNFMAVCEACTPEGEIRTVDGAGCCEGLATAPTMLCFDSACDDGMCAPGTCAELDASQHNDAQQFAYDCAPEVCVPSLELVLANASGAPGLECAGPGGSSECAASGGAQQQFVYESDALRLTVRFDAAILDGYSTESFNQHFDSVAGQLTIEDATVPITTFVETGTVSSFTYVDGRLQFTIDVPLADAFATIESDAEDCISDDITGVCACYYDGLGTYRVVVDLEIEAPQQ